MTPIIMPNIVASHVSKPSSLYKATCSFFDRSKNDFSNAASLLPGEFDMLPAARDWPATKCRKEDV